MLETGIAVIAADVETVGMVGRPHEGVEYIFGDSFISLPREVFTGNADSAYLGSGKLGARLFNAMSLHANLVEPGREKLCMMMNFIFIQFGLLLCNIGSSHLCSYIVSPH